ncbi:MAG: septum formation protein Maf [Sphingomonadales bacterium]|nr:septum formation protein Maf [Sphingomonadales bacterium]
MNESFPYELILASASPRRKELLERMGFDFRIEAVDADETPDTNLPVERMPVWLAKKKAGLVCNINRKTLVIAADTMVLLGNQILSKPENVLEASEMLKSLSGKTHRVITGVCLKGLRRQTTFSVTTRVRFGLITDDEIEYYIHCFEPFDKAGAYGVQEWIGLSFVTHISGSYTNVVGLPTERLYRELKKAAQSRRY